MRTCSGCQSEVPDDSETCPRCGNLAPRGFFSSLFGRFRAKPVAAPASSPPPPSSTRVRDVAGAFSMKAEDVFTISGRGTVVIGRIASGEIHVGDEVRLMSKKGKPIQCHVTGIEMFKKVVNVAKAGEDVGLLLRGVKGEDIEVGTTIEMV
jgi:translation elongation factor EF-G